MDYVPKLAKNNLYVAIQGDCRVKVEHLLVQCVLVLSISQLLLIFLMICDLYSCPNGCSEIIFLLNQSQDLGMKDENDLFIALTEHEVPY